MEPPERSRRSFAGRDEDPPKRKTEESWKATHDPRVDTASSIIDQIKKEKNAIT